jgi:hypothetical protein
MGYLDSLPGNRATAGASAQFLSNKQRAPTAVTGTQVSQWMSCTERDITGRTRNSIVRGDSGRQLCGDHTINVHLVSEAAEVQIEAVYKQTFRSAASDPMPVLLPKPVLTRLEYGNAMPSPNNFSLIRKCS